MMSFLWSVFMIHVIHHKELNSICIHTYTRCKWRIISTFYGLYVLGSEGIIFVQLEDLRIKDYSKVRKYNNFRNLTTCYGTGMIFKFPKLKILETIFPFFSLFFFLLFEVQKVKYLPNLLSNHRNSASLPMVILYKFWKREILIRPPGEL